MIMVNTFCIMIHLDIKLVFQLGLPRLNKFKNFKQALLDGDIETAQAEMKDSLWYRQTTNRADRLIEKLGKSA